VGVRLFQKNVWFQVWAALLKMPTLSGLPAHGSDDLLERRFGELGARDELVQVVHVGLVVLAVVKRQVFPPRSPGRGRPGR